MQRGWVSTLCLEYRLDQETFRGAVITTKRYHLAENPASRLSLDMYDQINGLSDLCLGVGERGLGVLAHDEIGKTTEGLLCRIGVNRCERSRMDCFEGIEQRSCLPPQPFAHDDPVRSPAESRLQKIVERDVGLERVGLAFDRQNVWLLDVKLRGVFGDDDVIVLRDEASQNPQEYGLADGRFTTDKQRLSAANWLR